MASMKITMRVPGVTGTLGKANSHFDPTQTGSGTAPPRWCGCWLVQKTNWNAFTELLVAHLRLPLVFPYPSSLWDVSTRAGVAAQIFETRYWHCETDTFSKKSRRIGTGHETFETKRLQDVANVFNAKFWTFWWISEHVAIYQVMSYLIRSAWK